MCFVWIWEQTAIMSLYSINWLVFINETVCLLRGTNWMYKIHVSITVLSVPPSQHHSTNATYISSPVCCSYQKDKRAKPRNLPKATLFRKPGSVGQTTFNWWSDGYRPVIRNCTTWATDATNTLKPSFPQSDSSQRFGGNYSPDCTTSNARSPWRNNYRCKNLKFSPNGTSGLGQFLHVGFVVDTLLVQAWLRPPTAPPHRRLLNTTSHKNK